VFDLDGQLLALDCKMAIDDNALERQGALAALRDGNQEEPAEAEAREIGLSYVKLDSEIDCMVNGADLAMETMDVIRVRGCPYGCEFCSVVLIFGRKVRTVEPVEVVKALKQARPKRILFCDDNFFISKRRGRELLVEMVDRLMGNDR
jgi:hypothetical protein